VLTTIDFQTGITEIHGVGVDLDSGEDIDAQLPSGVINAITPGIRVRVVRINHPEYEWRVVEIVAGGVATPDLSATQAARCEIRGAFVDIPSADIYQGVDALAQLLQEELDCEPEMTMIDAEALPLVFLAGEADFALIFFSDYHRLDDEVPFEPLLVPSFLEAPAYFRSAFIVLGDDSARSLADAQGMSFGYVRGSTYGYYMPRAMLADAGYDVNDFFSSTTAIGGSSLDTLNVLLDGDIEIGIIWAEEDRDARDAVEDVIPGVTEAVRILEYSPWIPNRVVVVRDDMPQDERQALAEALIAISLTDDGQAALNGIFSIDAFEAPDDRFWTAVEMMDLAEQLEDTIGPWQ
jgi:ABC-type phosphate/phosphonate transport system substrate-binding protein